MAFAKLGYSKNPDIKKKFTGRKVEVVNVIICAYVIINYLYYVRYVNALAEESAFFHNVPASNT